MANILYKHKSHNCQKPENHPSVKKPASTHTSNIPQIRHIVRKQESKDLKKKPSTNTSITSCYKPIELKKKLSFSSPDLSIIEESFTVMSRRIIRNNKEEKYKVQTGMISQNVEAFVKKEYDLGRKVYEMFMMNAWRHRRKECENMKKNLKNTGTQIDNLNVQVIVLRNLLESERNRVANFVNQAAHSQVMLKESLRIQETLKTDIECKEVQIKKLTEALENSENERMNVHNELLTCNSEKYSWEQQLTKEREKLAKMTEERTNLWVELKIMEESCDQKEIQIVELNTEKKELEDQIVEIKDTNQICMNEAEGRLSVLQDDKILLEKELNTMKESNLQLIEEIAKLEEALDKKTKENFYLNKACQRNLSEVTHLQEELNKSWKLILFHFTFGLLKFSQIMGFPNLI
uniref:Uncharacterized protein n=1 Tax=Clastoptera arizonana TaxID=38151 RepID=A0A1B6D8Z5_9HEMI